MRSNLGEVSPVTFIQNSYGLTLTFENKAS